MYECEGKGCFETIVVAEELPTTILASVRFGDSDSMKLSRCEYDNPQISDKVEQNHVNWQLSGEASSREGGEAVDEEMRELEALPLGIRTLHHLE